MAGITRIVVNLLLIVAMTIQPAMVYALPNVCSTAGATPAICQGCGCCQVQHPTHRCGCCVEPADVPADDSSSGCCQEESSDGSLTTETAHPSVAKTEVAVHSERVQLAAGTASRARASEVAAHQAAAMDAACSCLHAPETPSTPTPRSPLNEARELLAFGSLHQALLAAHPELGLAGHVGDTPRSLLAHFAQIEFGVWRL